MISFSDTAIIYIKIEPIDFRCGLNKLVPLAQASFNKNPREQAIFVFRNKRRSDIKLLLFDRNGFFMGHKRLSKGRLHWWPRTESECFEVDANKLLRLLAGVDPRGDFHPSWAGLCENEGTIKSDRDRGP